MFGISYELLEKHKAPDVVTEEHIDKWITYFDESEAIRYIASNFPYTDPATFNRWVRNRSNITAEDEANEDLLQADPDRYALFPLRDTEAYRFRTEIDKVHWLASEVGVALKDDYKNIKKISNAEYKLLKRTLGFFGIGDELVMRGLDDRVAQYLPKMEHQHYIANQKNQECVHSEAYSMQIEAVIPSKERDEVFNSIITSKTVGRMADWVRWWIVNDLCAADVFTFMAALEGILFSGFFASLQYFKTKNLFSGVTELNEFICKDEGIHTRWWCFLITKRLIKKPNRHVFHQIIKETVTLSDNFFREALQDEIPGFNSRLINQHCRSVADSVINECEYDKIFNIKSPFRFMDNLQISHSGKSNFFEHTPTQYVNITDPKMLEFTIKDKPVEFPE